MLHVALPWQYRSDADTRDPWVLNIAAPISSPYKGTQCLSPEGRKDPQGSAHAVKGLEKCRCQRRGLAAPAEAS